MKQSEVGPAVLAGQHVVVGEWQDWEVREHPSKTGGAPNVIETHFVLAGREVVPVERFAEKGKRAADLQRPAFKRGDRVVVVWRTWSRDKWGLRVNGEVQSLTA